MSAACAARSTACRPAVAPGCRRLIGDAAVIAAIGRAGGGLAAAEEEIRLAGIADRPMAFLVIEFEQRAALAERNDVLDRLDLRLGVVVVSLHGGERGVAAHHRARRAEHLRGGAWLARPRHRG